jgi:DNA replication protein DnaC
MGVTETMKNLKTNMQAFSKGIHLEPLVTKECDTCKGGFTINNHYVNGELKLEGDVNATTCWPCQVKAENEALAKAAQDDYEKNKCIRFFRKFSIVPDELEEARFTNFEPDDDSKDEAHKKALYYANNFEKLPFQKKLPNGKVIDWQSLLFKGEYGLGKSHLLHSIARMLVDKGYYVIFIDTPSFLRMIMSTFNKNSALSENEIFEAINKADFVVFDDIGAEYIKKTEHESWAVDKLFQALQSRIGKPTGYSTNYSSKDLTEKYGKHGGRLFSRMMKGTEPVKFFGDDYRMRGAF